MSKLPKPTRMPVQEPAPQPPPPPIPPKPSREAEIARQVQRHWHAAVPNDRMAHLIKDATRAFLRALQLRLAAHEVPFGHWSFLRILWQQDGLTQRELSLEAGVSEPTTSLALRQMQALGHVRLEHRGDNRKSLHVVLTAQGKRLQARLVPLAEAVNGVALAGIAPADVAATRRALLAMIDNLAQDQAVDQRPAPGPQRRRRQGAL